MLSEQRPVVAPQTDTNSHFLVKQKTHKNPNQCSTHSICQQQRAGRLPFHLDVRLLHQLPELWSWDDRVTTTTTASTMVSAITTPLLMSFARKSWTSRKHYMYCTHSLTGCPSDRLGTPQSQQRKKSWNDHWICEMCVFYDLAFS